MVYLEILEEHLEVQRNLIVFIFLWSKNYFNDNRVKQSHELNKAVRANEGLDLLFTLLT